jgi:hypothetical protein
VGGTTIAESGQLDVASRDNKTQRIEVGDELSCIEE